MVCSSPELIGDEKVPGYFPHRIEHPPVFNTPGFDLVPDHPESFFCSASPPASFFSLTSFITSGLEPCLFSDINGRIYLFLECVRQSGNLDIEETPDDCCSRRLLIKSPGHQVFDLVPGNFSHRRLVGEFCPDDVPFYLRDRINGPVFQDQPFTFKMAFGPLGFPEDMPAGNDRTSLGNRPGDQFRTCTLRTKDRTGTQVEM